MAKAPVKKSNSSIKRAKQSDARHILNTSILSSLKTQEKKVLKALEAESTELKDLFQKFVSMLDKAAKKNVLPKNRAASKKSLFNKRVAAGKSSIAKAPVKPKAARGESAQEKSKAKAKVRAKKK